MPAPQPAHGVSWAKRIRWSALGFLERLGISLMTALYTAGILAFLVSATSTWEAEPAGIVERAQFLAYGGHRSLSGSPIGLLTPWRIVQWLPLLFPGGALLVPDDAGPQLPGPTVDGARIPLSFRIARIAPQTRPKPHLKLHFVLESDLSRYWTWNSRQIYVYIVARYRTHADGDDADTPALSEHRSLVWATAVRDRTHTRVTAGSDDRPEETPSYFSSGPSNYYPNPLMAILPGTLADEPVKAELWIEHTPRIGMTKTVHLGTFTGLAGR